MATTFHRFQELPAELRARILFYAHIDDCSIFHSSKNRIIEFHYYDPSVPEVSLTVSRRYPVLFSVNREARYEAARIEGGTWMPVYLDGNSNYEKARKKSFEVYIIFEHDTIFLSERFMIVDKERIWTLYHVTPEEYRLRWFARLLDRSSLQKIGELQLSVAASPDGMLLGYGGYYLQIGQYLGPTSARAYKRWWKGEGLEIFRDGSFESLILVTNSSTPWWEAHIRHYVEEELYLKARIFREPPRLTMTIPSDAQCYNTDGSIIDWDIRKDWGWDEAGLGYDRHGIYYVDHGQSKDLDSYEQEDYDSYIPYLLD